MNEVNFRIGASRGTFEIEDFSISQYPHLKGSGFVGRNISVAVLFHFLQNAWGSQIHFSNEDLVKKDFKNHKQWGERGEGIFHFTMDSTS